MPALPSRGDVVRCLVDAGRALHARELATRLAVPDANYPRLLELLDQLAFDGTLRRLPGSRFRVSRQDVATTPSWEGTLTVHPRGFGFVAAPGHDDVYLAPDSIGAAMHGDRVEVTVFARTARGVEGRIERIVARRSPRIAGVLRRRGRSAWLEPDDTRLRGPIPVTLPAEGPEPEGVRDGVAAVIHVTRFPEYPDELPQASLVAVLGTPGTPQAEVAKILLREQLVEEHAEAARDEAVRLARAGLPSTADGREDLTEVPLPTIDPDDARDHDDAIWVVRTERGYRVWIAIADVSEYVTPGSALDAAALERGTSVYLPDRALPMLPPELSADTCSLLADKDRLCLCVIAELDRDGRVLEHEVVEGVMRSAAMLTYGGVARALGWDPEGPREAGAEALRDGLVAADEVARKLRRARLRRGALDLDLPEARIRIDGTDGMPTAVVQRAESPGMKRAYQLVEELMLLANELVARTLAARGQPGIHRVHAPPDEQKLERLGDVCETLGVPFDLEALLEPRGVGRWLARVGDHPRRAALHLLLLRSLKQAQYDVENIGHFGLASEAYLHFTSPIRRYPDLEVHRAVKRLLRGGAPDASPEAIEELRLKAVAASARERAAAEVEREIADLYRAIYMQGRVGDVLEGSVTGITGSGVYVQIPEPFVDVLVRLESMGPDHYEMTEDELAIVGLRSGDTIALGDPMVVEIEDVSLARRTVYGRRQPPADVAERLGRALGRRGHKGDGTRAFRGEPERARGGRDTAGAPRTERHRAPHVQGPRHPTPGGDARPAGPRKRVSVKKRSRRR